MHKAADFRWLLLRLAPSRWMIVAGLACFACAGIAATIDPLLMRNLLDRAIPSHSLSRCLPLVVGIGLCFVVRAILFSAGSLINFAVSQRCVKELRLTLFTHLTELSVEYHEATAPGETLTRIDHDVDEIARLGADTASQITRAALLLSLNLLMMAKLNWTMTLLVLPFIPLFAWIQWLFKLMLKNRSDLARKEIGAVRSFLTEHLSAVPQIQYLGAEHVTTMRISDLWDRMLYAQWRQRKTQLAFALSGSAILAASIVLVLISGSARVLTGGLTIGGLVAFYAYLTRVFDPVSSAMEFYGRLQAVGASIRRVRELLSLKPSVLDFGTVQFDQDSSSGAIRVSHLSYGISKRDILEDINLHIAAGERIAIVGRTGSGKSTLARLLVRSMEPTAGTIYLDEVMIPDYSLAGLRRAVCYVPQHPVLFDGSILDNLLLACPSAADAEIASVLSSAELDATISRLSAGVRTDLGPGASILSGGERQRVAIARALLKKPTVLILDEATSALDSLTEQNVLNAVNNCLPNCTLIVISHRLNNLAWMVDRLLILDRGRLMAAGAHRNLFSESVLYRTLYAASQTEMAAVVDN